MIFFILAIIPGLIVLYYFYKRDKLEPEPKSMIFKTLFLGIMAASIAYFFNIFFGSLVSRNILVTSVLIAPFVEEMSKFHTVKFFRFNDKHFSEPMDGIVYGVSVAVGFAIIENLLYIQRALEDGDVYATLIVRGFLSVPAHALFAVVWGYALGMYKFGKRDKEFVKKSLILSIMFHAAFNGIIIFINPLWNLLLLIIFSIYLWRNANDDIKEAIKNSPYKEYFKK